MDITHQAHDQQHKLWNGVAGDAWVGAQELLDQLFRPFEELLVEAAHIGSAQCVLDVGCGTGSTTLAVARRLGARGLCTGIDISEPMIAAARARGERQGARAAFIRADAQSHAFEASGFDAVLSRFGVMFFDDPVLAFANLRRATRSGGKLRVIVWRGPEENSFMTTAERAAAPLLPNIPPRRPNEPGQFGFSDPQRVQHILEESGWTQIDIRAVDVACTLPEKELIPYLSRLGPLGRALQGAHERTRAEVIDTVRAAFDPYVHGAEVRFDAGCWMITARTPSSPAAQKAGAHV